MEYIQLMLEGKTLKQCAKTLEISIPTAFYWRHKVLNALLRLGDGNLLSGIVETDETYFLSPSRQAQFDHQKTPQTRRQGFQARDIP